MSESVCLRCGAEMQYDWAPCPQCGWKAPGTWDESSEEPQEGTPAARHALLSSPRKWIRLTVWMVLVIALLGLFLSRLFP